jgi:hypothetical protein
MSTPLLGSERLSAQATVADSLGMDLSVIPFGSLISKLTDSWRARKTRKEAARFVALKVVRDLEDYVFNCAHAICDDGTERSSEGYAGQSMNKVPEIPSLPDDESPKILAAELLHEISELEPKRKQAQRNADSWADTVGDHSCYRSAVVENSTLLAALVLKVTKKIREAQTLPPHNWTYENFDIEAFLMKEEGEVLERQKKGAEREKREPSILDCS